jgi:hypothetical protein
MGGDGENRTVDQLEGCGVMSLLNIEKPRGGYVRVAVEILHRHHFYGKYRGHQIAIERDGEKTDWYIIVTAPDGTRAYDGWWRGGRGKPVELAILNALEGSLLLDRKKSSIELFQEARRRELEAEDAHDNALVAAIMEDPRRVMVLAETQMQFRRFLKRLRDAGDRSGRRVEFVWSARELYGRTKEHWMLVWLDGWWRREWHGEKHRVIEMAKSHFGVTLS